MKLGESKKVSVRNLLPLLDTCAEDKELVCMILILNRKKWIGDNLQDHLG